MAIYKRKMRMEINWHPHKFLGENVKWCSYFRRLSVTEKSIWRVAILQSKCNMKWITEENVHTKPKISFNWWMHKTRLIHKVEYYSAKKRNEVLIYTMCVCSITQLCLTLWDPLDYGLPGSLVHKIFQARILMWVAISSFRGSSQPRDRTHISCIGRGILYHWATWEAQS